MWGIWEGQTKDTDLDSFAASTVAWSVDIVEGLGVMFVVSLGAFLLYVFTLPSDRGGVNKLQSGRSLGGPVPWTSANGFESCGKTRD